MFPFGDFHCAIHKNVAFLLYMIRLRVGVRLRLGVTDIMGESMVRIKYTCTEKTGLVAYHSIYRLPAGDQLPPRVGVLVGKRLENHVISLSHTIWPTLNQQIDPTKVGSTTSSVVVTLA